MIGPLSPLPRSWPRRASIAAAFLTALSPLFGAESIDTVEKSATEWAKLRVETVRLETDWSARRAMLESSLVALKERVHFLETRRDTLKAKTTTDRQALVELKASAAEATKAMSEVMRRLDAIAAELVGLRAALPPRLASALELPYRSLAGTSTSAGDKVQLIAKVLNRCAQFNKQVTLADEVLTPEAGADARMLEVLYWGLSHAYALDRVNGKSYFGHPGEPAWVWEPLPNQTEKISTLIAIYKDKADPVLVEVPARVTDFAAEAKL